MHRRLFLLTYESNWNWERSNFQEIQINFAPPRPTGFANFRGAGRGGAALFSRGGAGRGGAPIPGSEWYRNRFSVLSSPLLHDKTWPAWPFCMTQTKRRLSTTERWRPKLIFLCFIANTLHEHMQCHPNHCNFTFTYFRNYWKGGKSIGLAVAPSNFLQLQRQI